MEDEKEKKLFPPYLAYKTLLNFLDRLKASVIPTRVDRGVMSTYSGTAQNQLSVTLRYLGLIDKEGVPKKELERLVNSTGEERQKVLKEILTASYPFIFKTEGFDLKRTSPEHLQELFEKTGVSGGTTRKSIAFFIGIAKSAGIELSPHLKKMKFSSTRTSPLKVKKSTEEKSGKIPPDTSGMQPPLKTELTELAQLLFSKFPEFDPSWPNEVKQTWFAGFKDIMAFIEQSKKEDM